MNEEQIGTGTKRDIESPWALAWRRFRKNRLALFGGILLSLFILVAIFAPYLAPYEPNRTNVLVRQQGPSEDYLLGTDDLGRCILSRTMFGARISLSVGVVAVSISMFIGLLAGSISGYSGGIIDTIIMRIADVFLSFPFLILAITASAVLGPSIFNIMIIIGVLSWPGPARILRAEFLKLKNVDFVQAASALGAKHLRIIMLHMLPNAIPPLLVSATLGVASAILLEAGLSFLGLGVPPPDPSWGNMLNRARQLHFLSNMPWMWVPPGIAIFLAVLSINFLGDGLRDALDPRQE